MSTGWGTGEYDRAAENAVVPLVTVNYDVITHSILSDKINVFVAVDFLPLAQMTVVFCSRCTSCVTTSATGISAV